MRPRRIKLSPYLKCRKVIGSVNNFIQSQMAEDYIINAFKADRISDREYELLISDLNVKLAEL